MAASGNARCAFCCTRFWDSQVTWNTTQPDFSPCFQKTVLMWIPVAFIWLLSPYKFYNLYHLQTRCKTWSWLTRSKVTLAVGIMVLMFVQCITSFVQYFRSTGIPLVNIISPLMLVLAMIFVVIVIRMEYQKGIRSSGYLLIFWLLLLIMGAFILQSKIRQAVLLGKIKDKLEFTVFVIYFVAVVASFMLSVFVDKCQEFEEVQQEVNPCPERDASFLSHLTFWWFTGMVRKGYKRALVRTDLWSLKQEDKSASIKKHFEKHWNTQLNKLHRGKKETVTNSTYTEAAYRDGAVSVNAVDGSERKKPSLLKTLIYIFSPLFFLSVSLKLMFHFLNFVSPMLLKNLIHFIQNREEHAWHGFLYAASMMIVALMQSLFFHQYLLRCQVMGMQLRSVTISAVYRKTLRLAHSAKRTSTVGEIVNLMSVDAQRFIEIMTTFHTIWSGPLEIVVCLIFLWQILGPSILAGMGVMVIFFLINAYITHKTRLLQENQMRLKDSRIKMMNEVLNGIKVLKLYAWEKSFQSKIIGIRKNELDVLKRSGYLNALNTLLWSCSPFLVSLITFATYTLSDSDNVLDAEKAFVSLSLFNIMRFPMSMVPTVITNAVKVSVSLKRLQKFLDNEELDCDAVQHSPPPKISIKIDNGTFTWDRDASNTIKNINLEVEEGSLVAVVGLVGAGKSSLISAMLGEMDKLSGTVNIRGSVAYVAQQAWIQNTTLRNNVLFNGDYNQQTYDRVLLSCALQRDLKSMPAGDQTEIGERGLNLSGGQKQRISLARAIYQDADIYLLDDPLSTVDSHVGKHIFEHVIGPDGILKDKTRILVTHGLSFLPKVDKIVVLVDGHIEEVGSFSELKEGNGAFVNFLTNCSANDDQSVETSDDPLNDAQSEETSDDPSELEVLIPDDDDNSSLGSTASSSAETVDDASLLQRQTTETQSEYICLESEIQKRQLSSSTVMDRNKEKKEEKDFKDIEGKDRLIQPETVSTGKVKFSVFKTYVKAMGLLVSIIVVLFYFLYETANVSSGFWLSTWSNDASSLNATHDPEQRDLRLGVYGALGIMQGIFIFAGAFLWVIGAHNASCLLHLQFLTTLLKCPMHFYDVTPQGRLMSGFSKDIDTIDVLIPSHANTFLMSFLDVLGTSVAISLGTRFFLIAILLLIILYYLLQAHGGCKASEELHAELMDTVLHQAMAFFDTTPLGRIVNRFGKDINVVDMTLPSNMEKFLHCCLKVLATVLVVAITTPTVLLAVIIMAILYYFIQKFYVATSRQLKRLEFASRSPIYSHFGETMAGATTIRAFHQQDHFIQQSERKVDENQMCYYPSVISNRWLGVRLEFLGSCIVFFASLFAVIGREHLSPGIVGLSVSYAMNVTQTLNNMVLTSCHLETNIVAVERVKEYTELTTEAEWEIPDKKPENAWPQHGVIHFRNYQTRYREGLEPALCGISCSINSGEKIGIVGRTGAGKTSLLLALFRILEAAEGKIIMDDITIGDIGLHDLRSKLTIIPQDPVIFSGSLRTNLDPFDVHKDEELWQALDQAHLKNFLARQNAGLQFECTEGGENLSVGQRQLVCLARALLRKSKILVLDEATAAVDLITDSLIQGTIHREFAECTVLTVAHRLNTIMDYTKIMVLDAGKIIEFDEPQTLLQDPNTVFYGMAKDAGLLPDQ